MTYSVRLLLALALASSASLALAQPGAADAAPKGTQVALVDLLHVLRNYPTYTAKKELLRDKLKALGADEAAHQKAIQQASNKLKEFTPGSLEFKNLEAEMAQQFSDAQVQLQIRRRDLADQDAKLMYEAYMEVQRVVDGLAADYGIDLVIRYDRQKIDATDRDSIARGLMNPIMYHRNLDLTDLVIKQLPQATAVRPPVKQPQRPLQK